MVVMPYLFSIRFNKQGTNLLLTEENGPCDKFFVI